jgi:glycosyltransferase involved in cell wall biosynthesis
MGSEKNLSSALSINPRVSIVIPCYNCAETIETSLNSIIDQTSIETSLNSIIDQTFNPLEIIAVDDGSTDATLSILKGLAVGEERLRILPREHQGIVGALNAGVAECRGQYIARMDADDLAHSTRFEKQIRFLDQHPDIGVVGCLVEAFPTENVGEGFKHYLSWMNGLVTHDQIAREIFVESPFAHPTVMIRKKWLDRIGGYAEVRWAEDYDLWMRFYLAGLKFGKVPEVLLSWREQPNRLTWTDDRYSKENFLRAKSHYLPAGPLKGKGAVIIWGAGQTGKKVVRLLLGESIAISAFVDIDPSKIGRQWGDIPIVSPKSLPDLWDQCNDPVLLAAVAARGARELIRNHLRSIGLIEGQHWWAVA